MPALASDPPASCGNYDGASCDEMLMSEVLGEAAGTFLLKQCVAALLGMLIGLQREFGYLVGMWWSKNKLAESPVRRAGLRTHMLVALGSCLFSEASWSLYSVPVPTQLVGDDGTNGRARAPYVSGTFNYDSSRVAAQIVSGIGFLGAGTIWKASDQVFGLTTAASLWTTAAVGMHVGGVHEGKDDTYFLAPCFATLLVVVTLQILIMFELWVHRWMRSYTMRYQAARATLGVAPHASVENAVHDVVDEVEKKVGQVVALGAVIESGVSGPCAAGGGGAAGVSSASSAGGIPASIAEDDRTRRLEISLTVVVPPFSSGVVLLDRLAMIDGVYKASIAEQRSNVVSFVDAGGARGRRGRGMERPFIASGDGGDDDGEND